MVKSDQATFLAVPAMPSKVLMACTSSVGLEVKGTCPDSRVTTCSTCQLASISSCGEGESTLSSVARMWYLGTDQNFRSLSTTDAIKGWAACFIKNIGIELSSTDSSKRQAKICCVLRCLYSTGYAASARVHKKILRYSHRTAILSGPG
jgi:hypothetical protein